MEQEYNVERHNLYVRTYPRRFASQSETKRWELIEGDNKECQVKH